MFLLPTMKEAKNWYPYDIGDMSDYLFHTYDVSFEFLEPAGKVFQAWEASNISTSKFFSLPMLQNWRTRERGQLILGAQKHDKAEKRLKHWWFFSAQK
jgi:hypothetical protein